MLLVLLWFLLAGVAIEIDGREKLIAGRFTRGGVNVCERRSVNTESYTITQTTHYPVSRRTKCGLFNWGRCNVQRTATRTITLIRTRKVDVVTLYCCDGWKERSVSGRDVCDDPYCRLGCKNGGTCLGGNKCRCPPGWIGELCDTDVNECQKNNGGCQQICTNTPGSFACGCSRGYEPNINDKARCDDYNECDQVRCTCANQESHDCGAICTNTIGSFKCSCKKGYRIVGSTVCQDIDECLSPATNKCPLKCINLPGTYGCDCMRGFRRGKDGKSCEDKNECVINNGGCQHKCLNTYGSYVCQCRLGFKLHRNRMRCLDVDECQSFHGCEMQCNNTYGSYFCSCPRGYALNADNFTCNDVDECSLRKVKGLAGNLSLSDCEQQCINTVGSFKCSCKRGFLLRSDGKTCKDADECTSGTHKCDHKCTNTFGSYVCSCRPGYKLTADKKTCMPLPCESIESPFHGSIKCDGARTGATCLFTCDPGYQLLGSSRRYCLPSSKWNGTKTTCKAKSCPEIQVPENAAVLLPCYKTFRSKCILQCSEGYYSKIDDDSSATCDVDNSGALEWNLNNFNCEKLQICQPNPCQNDGKCLIQGRQHICDCKGTGFEGSECQTGIITTPVFDKLKPNEQSRTFYLHAQPKNELIVTIQSSQSLIIKPKRELRISKSKKVAFSIVPMKAGFHIISYSISGQDAKIYKVPDNSTVYVKTKQGAQSVYKQLQIPEKTLPVGCHSYTHSNNLFKCQVNLTSSHPWVSKSSGFLLSSTAGIVHINTKYASIPISIFGTSDGTLTPTTEELLTMIHKVSSKSMNSSISISKNGKCEVRSLTSENLLEFIQTDAFPNTMLAALSSFMPKWIQLNTDKNNDLFDISNLVVSAGKPPSYGPGSCENLPPTSSLNSVFYKPSVAFEAHLDSETKKFGSNEPACFGIDVCKNRAFVDLSLNARKSLLQIPTVQSMKIAGWDFGVSSFGLGKKEPGDKDSFDLWMKGDSKVHLKNSHLSIGLNLTGQTTTRSECFDELFTRQFTCPIYGNIKGKISMRTTMQLENSKKTSLNFKSDKTTGKFLFGGKDERNTSNRLLPDRCGSSQGAHITLKAKENPFQGSLLSQYILPYLQHAINVSIYNTIEGGGRTGVKVPPDMRMKLMILGFMVKPFQTTIQGTIGAVPQLDSEMSNLVKMVSKLDALTTKASQLLNTKVLQGETAENFKTTVFSIESTISNIVKLSTTLSSKLSRHKSNFKIMSLIAGAQSFEQNIKTVVPLKLDTIRSPVKQDLKGLLIGTVAQVCLGQLCIPDVKVMVDSPGNARKTRCDTGTALNNQPFLTITAFPFKNTRLGKIISVQENKPMEIRLAPNLLMFDGIFNMFGMSKEAQVNITDKQVNAEARGDLFGKFKCKVHLTADSNVDDWRSLVFKAKGTMDNRSRLTKMLEEHLNNYALNLVGKSEKRVEKAKTAYENATLKLQSAQQFLNFTLDVFDELKNNDSILQKLFTKKKAFYTQAIHWFDNALYDYNVTIASLNRETCELTKCNRICNKTCVQDVCWDKVNVTYDTADCKYTDSFIEKLKPFTKTTEHEYKTTPSIRKDLGKCKMGVTSFFESFLTFGLYNGKRRKRSIHRSENESVDMRKKTVNINKYLRARNSTLELNFDINIELRKRIPKLPRTFDFNRVLNSYILKQYNFNVNKILREKFPALPSNFDIDKELLTAVPALKTNFVFDEFLREIVLQAAGHKKNVNFKKELEKLSPQLAKDFDKVLKRSLPELQALNSITELIQKYLDSILISSFDQKKFDKFDINSVFMSDFRGFPNGFNINKLLQNQIPQLAANFDINKLIKNAILGNGPNVQQLDELIAKTAGIPGFSLQVTLSRLFPGFDKRFNLEELIKTEMNNMISVKANRTKLNTLTFNKIIQNVLPKFQHRDIDSILTKAFPGLESKFNFREILKGAIPLMKIIGDVDLNQLVKSLFPSTALLNLDLDIFLKRRNPALRGEVNIERFLSKRLKEVSLPSFNIIFKKAYQGSPKMPSNLENLIEDIIGMDGIKDLRNLVYYSVFPDSKGETTRIFDNDMDGEQRGRPRRRKRFLGVVGKIIKTAVNVLNPVGNLVNSIIDAKKNSGCTHIYHTTFGTPETHKYIEMLTTLISQNVTIKKWTCENWRTAKMPSEGYQPRTCCRKDIPCVEFLDPVCVNKSILCFNQKEIKYKMSQSVFNASLFEQHKKLVSTEKEVNKVAMRLEESRLRKQLGLQNIQITKARVSQLRAMENTSRIVYEKIKRIPQVDLGFKVKSIVKDSFADRPLRVTDLSFSTVSSTLSKSRLPFQATIQTKSGKDLVLDFIIDFENINSSLSYAREEAIRQYTSSSKRKRRSIDDLKSVIPQDDSFDSCLFANNASLYFSDILNSLRLVVKSNDEQNLKITDEINALDDAVSSMEKNDTDNADDSVTKDYIHVLSIYRNKRQEQTEMASWNDTLVTWKNFVENVTEMRQLPNCSGSIDCIEELNEKLSQHYLSLGNKSDVLNMVTMLEELTSGIKELLDDDVTEESVKLELKRLSILLNKTKDKDLLCGNKPKMLTNNTKEVRLLNGESITLHCNASSQTEITYFWRRGESLIQTSKQGTLVLRNVQDTDEGLYRCEARNLKGIVFSGIKTIVIEAKPLILEHPEAVQVPLNRASAVSFTCVATGKPKPTVTWLYRPPSSNFSVVLQNENSNILSITPDNVNKSGYYYCEALNTRGLVVSREARLDVMRVEKANPKIAILFNATKQCKKEVCRKNQNIPSRLDATLRNSILSMISKPMRVSFKDIKRLRYWQISEALAQIAMYVTSPTVKNTGKFLSNDQMMEQFSEARVHLTGRLKRLLYAMNKTVLVGDNSSAPIVGLVDTLGFLHVEPDCPPGQWIHSDGYYCVQCPPGSHKEGYEGRCQKCPAGTYQPRSGQADCTPCGVHQTTSREGSIDVSNCFKKVICPPGSFASKIDKCEKCPPKTYQPLYGQKSCLPCSTGSLLENGQSTCKKVICPPGSYVSGIDKCEKCPPKTYQPLPDQVSCITCSTGSLLENGQSSCKKEPGVPENFIVIVLSSTSVELHWLQPTHTAVSYYELEYGYPGSSVIRTIKVQPIRDTDSLVIYKLRDLEKYTKYSVKVYAVLGTQRGKPATLSFRTQEDVPEKSPTIITSVPLNTTAIEVTWKELPMHARNGIILSYTVYVKESAFPKYTTKQVDSQTRSTIVTGLNKNTIYCIRITASTVKGPSLNWKRSKCSWAKTKYIIM